MDEGLRKSRGQFKKASGKTERDREMYERRPLKTTPLSPPDYHINPQILLDSYTEKEVKFAGNLVDVLATLDPTNRTDVLRLIDRGKLEERLPWQMTHEHDAVFCLSAHNIKLARRDGKEELLLRLPIHEVAAICYINDDSQHILAIKHGDREKLGDVCHLAVLYCDGRTAAEEICSLIGQCFQLVYTEATMQFLDSTLAEAAHSVSYSSSTTNTRSDHSNTSTPQQMRPAYGFFSVSELDLVQRDGTHSNSRSLPVRRRSSTTTPSDSEISASASDLIKSYMDKLHHKLNHDELRRFAILLKDWHSGMPFPDFCDRVLELYGPNRKYLLVGMRPFIPDKDLASFEAFLERVGGNGIWSDPLSNNSQRYRRTRSGSSHSNNGNGMDEYDRILRDISADVENLEVSVDMDVNPDAFLPKTT